MTMQGYVNLYPKEPRLTVAVLDPSGTAVPLEMVIDTGFTGFMTLPSMATRVLGLEKSENRMVKLADGQVVTTPTCLATVIWHGRPARIPVLEIDDRPVIGMSLLWNSDVFMSARENGRVLVSEASG